MKQIIFIRKLKDYFLSTGKLTKVIILLVLLLLPLLIYGNYQYRKTCRGLVDVAIRSKSFFNLNYKNVFDTCLKQANTGDYRELYAYYKITNYVDRVFGDKGENNKYHWMLFYANEIGHII